MYPFLSEQQLVREVFELRDAFARPDALFPAWLDQTPLDVLRSKKFVVCGSVCRSEIRVLAKAANVIAIVDDFLCQKQSHLYGIPVIDSDAWVALAAGQGDVVSCLLTPGGNAFQHFTKLATQWSLPVLLPLQFLYLIKTCGIDVTGETGRFFWYGHEFFTAVRDNVDQLVKLASGFADPFSRISWLCVLLYRLTLNPFYLEACAVGHHTDGFKLNSYSTNREFFKFGDEEVYVDGGAFDGDTLQGFLRACNGRFKHIHTFEPSAVNNQAIRARLVGLRDEYLLPLESRITQHEAGLWSRTTTLAFNASLTVSEYAGNGGGYAQVQTAHLLDTGLLTHIYDPAHEQSVASTIAVTTVDEAADLQATFIKLEIEGAELEALHGARQTIARNRPQMAISMYHKPEDLLTLTQFVQETDKGYRLGFRQHHRLYPDGMVMYCS